MERWIGKVAVITGASAGIGAAIAIDLANCGLIVVGLARRKEKVEALKKNVFPSKGQLHAYECDVSDQNSVQKAFDWVKSTFGRVNILVNNAGIIRKTNILDDHVNSMTAMNEVINTNICGLLYCTRAAYAILKETGEPGHIVNIGSIAGHGIPYLPPPLNTFNVYPGTKHCVKAINEVIRQELVELNHNVKVSMISPGLVKTEIMEAGGVENPDYVYTMNYLNAEDVSAACLYILGTPPTVQVHDLVIKPVGEKF